MKSIFALVVAALLLVTFVQSETIYSDEVVVRDMKLFVGGKEFFVKGMAYNPAPLGILNMTADGYGGTGYCSAKKTVFGEYRSACFGSDYFDGVKAESTRVPPGPKDSSGKLEPFWQKVWDRDLAVIKGMGANAIRIYNMNPLTQTFLDMFPNEYDVTEPGRAAEHITFFDLCQKHGLKVIAPIVTDQTFITSNPEDLVNKHIDSEITEIGNHPALLMYTLGNEMPVFTDSSLLALVNKYMARVRSRQQAIWNRRIPVTHAIVDTPEVYEYLVEKLDVDLFTTNAGYRDIYMDPLWEGEGDFMGWTKLSQKYNMTLLIGEVGMHQEGDEITQARPDWFNQQWKAIVTRIPDGCIGGVFFEYNDEYQKGSAENGKDRHMGAMIPTVATQNGKTSLTADAWIPDEMVEKPIVFNSIKSGHPGSAFAEYNMNADVFKLIGRSQQSIAVVDRDSDNGGAGSDDGENRESSSATVAISAVALVVALVAAAL